MADRRTVKAVSDDLNRLEDAHHHLDTSHQLLRKDVDRNREDLLGIATYFRFFMKVVITLLLTAVIGFIVQGGLV